MKKIIFIFLLISVCLSAQIMGMEERPAKKPRTEVSVLLEDQIPRIICIGDFQGLRILYGQNSNFFISLTSEKLSEFTKNSEERYRLFKEKMRAVQDAQFRLNAHRSIRNFFCALAQMSSFDGIQSYFSNPRAITPSAKPDEIIKHLVGTEQEKIAGCMFHLTLFDLAKKMGKQRTLNGNLIEIDLITDHKFRDYNCQALNQLVANGGQVSIPSPTTAQQQYEQMHHKFFIFYNTLQGKRILVTGSCNATGYAATNSWDNIILIDDSATIDRFIQEFELLKEISRPLALAECKKNDGSSYTSLRNDRVPEGRYDDEGRFAPYKA